MTGSKSPTEILEQKRRDLTLRYVQSLDTRILGLENAAAGLRLNPDQTELMQFIGTMCHKLAGISESVGQPEIGRLSAKIDNAINDEHAQWQDIEQVLETLLVAMEDQLT